MTESSIQAIVLAAGKSTRFGTQTTKLLHKICGQEMILFPIKLLDSFSIPTTIIVGCQSENVQECIAQGTTVPHQFIEQKEQRGTGHALLCSQKAWHAENILIINGDMPLINQSVLKELIETHFKENADVTFVTSHNSDVSQPYGRVIEEQGRIRIVEARHIQQNLNDFCCINAGIYLFKTSFLRHAAPLLQQNPESNECYITDLVEIASQGNFTVKTVQVPFDVVRGVNTMKELWAAEHVQRSTLISHWMNQGVRFTAAHTVHIDINVTIGAGTTIGCSVHLLQGTTIGKNCIIDSFSTLDHATLGDGVHVKQSSLLYSCSIDNQSQIGPFAHIQENTHIGIGSHIGNFVEVKRSTIGNNTKIKHLSYIGDAIIGNNVNIGAGTITCNYDGTQKHETVIKDNTFIGSNNTLIAPVTIEENSFTAGGSTITDTVPSHALAIGRARQVIKENYVKKKEKTLNDSLYTYSRHPLRDGKLWENRS